VGAVRKALVVVAHPDDETIFFGGLLASLVAGGADVDVLSVTSTFASAAAGAVRRAEFREACAFWGVRSLLLGFKDSRGERSLPVDAVASAIARCGRGTSYDEVATHGVWGEYGHAHHRDVCRAVHRALGAGVWSLAGPAPAERTIALGEDGLRAKRRVATTAYRSQPLAAAWCSDEERFVRLRPDDVEFLSRVADGLEAPAARLGERRARLLRDAARGLGPPPAYPEAAHIPKSYWRPRQRPHVEHLRSFLPMPPA
jgi:LmbE family N-acetylglucosaminyl deacetylase